MPIVLYFRTFGYAKANVGKDLNNLIFDQRHRVTASDFHRKSGTGKVVISRCCCGLSAQLFFEFVDFCFGLALEFVDNLSEFLFFFFRNFLEFGKEVIE